MIIWEGQQHSDEYWLVKCGVPSSSNFSRIVTSKGEPSKQMHAYIAELIAECACLCPPYFTQQGRPVTRAMTAGQDNEPEARRWYCMERKCEVRQVGCVFTDDRRLCASTDGLIGDDGVLELKAPMLKTQATYLMKGELPNAYRCQVHGELLVTGRAWADFCSYSPGLDGLIIRVYPDAFTDKLRDSLEVFLGEYETAKKKLLKPDEMPAY